jgi:NitT/TauT family transport system ATP-binding protein
VDEHGVVVQTLSKVFRQQGSGEPVTAIRQLDFRIEPGQMVSIVGKTGCGKSTFLAILLGLEQPSGGQVLVDGKTPYADFHAFKGKIACIFQQDRLLPWRSALDNVKLALEVLGFPKPEQEQRSREWLDRLGLTHFLQAYPHELSGGMRQRVAMARAFVIQPRLLLADEAFGHLDEVTAASLRKEFAELAAATGMTTVSVTHQLEEAFELGSRILVFGRPATLLWDLRYDQSDKEQFPALRRQIQAMIDQNEPVPGGSVPGWPSR